MSNFEFTRLADVEKIETMSEEASVLIENDGAVKRVPAGSIIPDIPDSGLPEGAAGNQMLVTDADGVAKWDNRLAYVYTEAVVDCKPVTLEYDSCQGVCYGSLYFDTTGLSEGTPAHMTISGDYQYDGEVTLTRGGCDLTMDSPSGVTLTCSTMFTGGHLYMEASPADADVKIVVTLTVTRIQRIDRKFLPDGMFMTKDEIKANIVDLAKNCTRVSMITGRSTDGSQYTAESITGYQILKMYDDCSGEYEWHVRGMVGDEHKAVKTFYDNSVFNEICAAWGVSSDGE